MERRWKVLAIASTGAFLAFLDATIVNIAFPDIHRSFRGDSLVYLSWVLSAYNIVFAAALIPAGKLADVVGRRRVFLAGLLAFCLGSALCAAASSATELVGARVIQSLGGAALVPSSVALLLAEFPVERRSTAVGLWSGVAGIAAAMGPSLGGVLINLGGWRLVFLVNLPVGIAAAIAASRVLRSEESSRASGLPDLAGALTVTAAIGALALGIVQGPQWGWGSARILAAFAAAGVLAPLLIWRCARHSSPVIELSLFRLRSVSAGNVGTLLFSAGFYGMLLCHVLFLTTVWRYSVLDAGLAMSIAPLTAGAVAAVTGRVADRFGPRVLAVPGAVVFAAGNLWFASQVGAAPHFVAQWLPGASLSGIGVGLCYPALGSAAVADLTATQFSIGSSLNAMSRQIGGVLGISVVIAIIQGAGPTAGIAPFVSGWRFALAMALLALGASIALGGLSASSARAIHVEPSTFSSTART